MPKFWVADLYIGMILKAESVLKASAEFNQLWTTSTAFQPVCPKKLSCLI